MPVWLGNSAQTASKNSACARCSLAIRARWSPVQLGHSARRREVSRSSNEQMAAESGRAQSSQRRSRRGRRGRGFGFGFGITPNYETAGGAAKRPALRDAAIYAGPEGVSGGT